MRTPGGFTHNNNNKEEKKELNFELTFKFDFLFPLTLNNEQ